MNNPKNTNSTLPLVIIGAVLLVVLGSLWWFMSQPKKPATSANRSNVNRPNAPTPNMVNAPLGAQPPNMLGSPTASVTVEEFADFQCPTCSLMHPRMKEIISTYGSRIKFIYRNYPLAIPAHDKAYEASVAAESAGLQGKFWDMQNLLYTNQKNWSANPDYRKIWEEYAGNIGLDVEKFKNDMAGLNAKARVDADLSRGRGLNVSSTPSIYVNGVSVPYEQMSVEGLRQIIDAELQKSSGGGAGGGSQPVSNAPANTNK